MAELNPVQSENSAYEQDIRHDESYKYNSQSVSNLNQSDINYFPHQIPRQQQEEAEMNRNVQQVTSDAPKINNSNLEYNDINPPHYHHDDQDLNYSEIDHDEPKINNRNLEGNKVDPPDYDPNHQDVNYSEPETEINDDELNLECNKVDPPDDDHDNEDLNCSEPEQENDKIGSEGDDDGPDVHQIEPDLSYLESELNLEPKSDELGNHSEGELDSSRVEQNSESDHDNENDPYHNESSTGIYIFHFNYRVSQVQAGLRTF